MFYLHLYSNVTLESVPSVRFYLCSPNVLQNGFTLSFVCTPAPRCGKWHREGVVCPDPLCPRAGPRFLCCTAGHTEVSSPEKTYTGHSCTAMPLSPPSQLISAAHTRSCCSAEPRDWGNKESEITGGNRHASNGTRWIDLGRDSRHSLEQINQP